MIVLLSLEQSTPHPPFGLGLFLSVSGPNPEGILCTNKFIPSNISRRFNLVQTLLQQVAPPGGQQMPDLITYNRYKYYVPMSLGPCYILLKSSGGEGGGEWEL